MIPRGPTIDSGHCGTGIPPITAWLRVLVLTGNRMLDAWCRDVLSSRRSVDEFPGSWVVLVFLIMVQKYSGETNWLFAPSVVTHFPNVYEKSTSIFSIPVVSNDAS